MRNQLLCLLGKIYKQIRDIMNIKNKYMEEKKVSLTMHAKAMYQIT